MPGGDARDDDIPCQTDDAWQLSDGREGAWQTSWGTEQPEKS
jgi:hypothetical protein